MKNFDYWKTKHDSDNLEEFSTDNIGLLWLKLKSILRKEIIVHFIEKNKIQLSERSLANQFRELFGILIQDYASSHRLLNDFIVELNAKQLQLINTEQLVSELYKLKTFDWGGDYKNSLDKYLVSKYVKIYTSYDTLISKLETEIPSIVNGYVLNSWFNHWSSILIEHIFKSHNSVLPTVGQIKGVDFFINDIPFDLKVTYLPSEFIRTQRAKKGLPVELTFLKRKAREANIPFNVSSTPSDIYYEITEKMKDRSDTFSLSVLENLKQERLQILEEAKINPAHLTKWFYENQGEMRFGSENRLFLVLVDSNDFNSSWKLKRNLDVLTPSINKYLDDFCNKNINDLRVSFTYSGKSQTFSALADIIFVVK
ncbi:MAG: hypothetical protein F9K23_01540 [Bacteroidetes bacterium]|nr:MAG: hypothetical protein F9K23_01540 [Bacteroidota bacterium]